MIFSLSSLVKCIGSSRSNRTQALCCEASRKALRSSQSPKAFMKVKMLALLRSDCVVLSCTSLWLRASVSTVLNSARSRGCIFLRLHRRLPKDLFAPYVEF